MGVTIDVPPGVLAAAKTAWDDAADGLDGAWRRLGKASTAGFAPAVVTAVEAFQTTWTDELKRRAEAAQANSDAFVEVSGDFEFTDAAAAEQARALLGWAHRAAPIGER
ncbi:hypothetical protein ACOACQ_04510 [Nocardioides sp. CPCC 206347]|jgi:hypothetical protein|uniref:hypothetical protein n=1 Tax=Nocardioides sp. CPCC 206347 TaxID=3406463 RepID=UPI003B438EAA